MTLQAKMPQWSITTNQSWRKRTYCELYLGSLAPSSQYIGGDSRHDALQHILIDLLVADMNRFVVILWFSRMQADNGHDMTLECLNTRMTKIDENERDYLVLHTVHNELYSASLISRAAHLREWMACTYSNFLLCSELAIRLRSQLTTPTWRNKKLPITPNQCQKATGRYSYIIRISFNPSMIGSVDPRELKNFGDVVVDWNPKSQKWIATIIL